MKVEEVPEGVEFFNEHGRHIPLLAPRTPQRRAAERMLKARDKGLTYREIAQSMHLPQSTVFRLVRSVLLTHEVEAGKRDQEIARMSRPAKKAATAPRQRQHSSRLAHSG